MSEPLLFRGKMLQQCKHQAKHIERIIKNNNVLFIAVMLTIFGSMVRLWNAQPTFYAQAYTGDSAATKVQSPLFDEQQGLFDGTNGRDKQVAALEDKLQQQTQTDGKIDSGQFAQKIYEIVGDAPIREMVPFISQRDEKVAAFLVGIAKKESSFGLASPSKNGESCYNYWGYKGEGGRGTGMGYACFASAEEAVKVVGDRIEVLVNKQRNTPERMVDTWKCGSSCAGDPGAPSWISTVALYFDKLVG